MNNERSICAHWYTRAMQFQVPQFIEVEDKIFGPLTFRQFVYLGGGVGFAYILLRVLPAIIAFPIGISVIGLAVALAFFKFNGRPFIAAVENSFYFLVRPRLYLWNNEHREAAKKAEPVSVQNTEVYVPKLSESRLHELAWSLDIKERISSGSASDEDRAQYDAMKPILTARDAMI